MQNPVAQRATVRGFTLIELIAALAVAATLATIAAPNFQAYVLNARRDGVVDGLTAALYYARNQALNLDQPTTLCAGVPGPRCAGGNWNNGWQVVTLPAASATVTLTTHVVPATSSRPTLAALNGSVAFVFDGRGLVTNMVAAGNEIMTVCDTRGASAARAVEVNRAGYIQSSPRPGVQPDGTTALVCP